MAKRRLTAFTQVERPKKRRPGIHAKTKTSRVKQSKNYCKPYKGQGR